MMKNAVEVRGLVVDRGGRQVLRDLNFTIGGGVTGLLGPSGCGKSTLMRALVGVQKLTSGSVQVYGEEAGSKSLRSRVGYLTQAASVYDDLSVTENLAFFARVLGVGPDRVTASIDAVDLGSHADQVVGQLSGGQRSRVSLATALLGEPDLLVLDEADRCDRLLLMREGRIIADGSPDEVRQRTNAPDIESAFLALVAADGDAA